MPPLPPPQVIIAAVLTLIVTLMPFLGGSSTGTGSSGTESARTSTSPSTPSPSPEPPPETTEPEPTSEEDVTPRPEATVIDGPDIVSVTGNRVAGYRVELTGRHELGVGDPVAVPVTSANPTGVVGRITGVGETAGGTTFTADAAPLDEVYSEFRISREIPVNLPLSLAPEAFTCDGGSGKFIVDAPDLRAVVTLRLDISRETAAISTELTGSLSLDAATDSAVFCSVDPSALPRATVPVEGPLALTVGATVASDSSGPAEVHLSATEKQVLGAVVVGARSEPVTAHTLTGVAVSAGPADPPGEDGATLSLGSDVGLSTGTGSDPGFAVVGDTALSVFPAERNRNRYCFDVRRQQTVTVATDRGLIPWTVTPLSERNDSRHAGGSCSGTADGGPIQLPGGGHIPDSPVGDREVVTTGGPLDELTVTTDLRCDPRSTSGGALLSPGPCATRVTVDGATYGAGSDEPLRLLSRSIRGEGTVERPIVITTRLAVGAIGVYVDQVDTLVRGSAGWATTTAVRNRTDVDHRISVTRAIPCSNGAVVGGSSTVACDRARLEAYSLGVTASVDEDTAGLIWERSLRPGKSAAFRSRLFFDVPAHEIGA
ncbi:hypothetical protein M0E87_11465 [Corynebacterium sp. CCM 9185]|uniref:Secreted protein n=1 Tax=Corynebacterium marambiense TaxID=2765364 RepID=A0ABS0VXI6_9CORY|nr:hypothetical protein [Corynebacterium marambiense]MBI9001024.1 hypothetical protein [Corynebacterium marambiense]MCK7664267.1 hypothetical protein [Corynebacterium marambiense]